MRGEELVEALEHLRNLREHMMKLLEIMEHHHEYTYEAREVELVAMRAAETVASDAYAFSLALDVVRDMEESRISEEMKKIGSVSWDD